MVIGASAVSIDPRRLALWEEEDHKDAPALGPRYNSIPGKSPQNKFCFLLQGARTQYQQEMTACHETFVKSFLFHYSLECYGAQGSS